MLEKTCLFLCVTLLLSACGGSSKPAEEPSGEASSESESKDDASEKDAESSADDSAKDAKASSEKDEAEKPSSEPTPGTKLKRSAKDIVTMPDVIFMFSFNESDMKDRAEKECDKQGTDDPKKRADCMTRAKKNIEIDAMAFKEEKGKWYWLTIKLKGKTLVNLHKIPVEFTKESDHSLVLKPIGKDEGTKRGGDPGETKIDVPNEYQIVFDDPKQGKMVYEAKIGMTGQ